MPKVEEKKGCTHYPKCICVYTDVVMFTESLDVQKLVEFIINKLTELNFQQGCLLELGTGFRNATFPGLETDVLHWP